MLDSLESGSSEASARLDEELKLKIVKAMEKAFKHFDTDHSNTIDIEEFVEVLRALGQDLTTKEVRSILKKTSRSTEVLHFEEFEKAVYPFLREKISQSSKVSEAALKTTFQVSKSHQLLTAQSIDIDRMTLGQITLRVACHTGYR